MIVREDQRLVMEFIATANRGGYRPTGREINEWRLQPDPRPRERGELLEPEVPAVPERRVRRGVSQFGSIRNSALLGYMGQNQDLFRSIKPALDFMRTPAVRDFLRIAQAAGPQVEYDVMPAKPGRPAKYAADKPAEKYLAHLRRLGWISRNDKGGYEVTLLGHALMRAEASASAADDESSVMVLTAEDELAYGRVLGIIADSGEALIVDGYLGAQELVHILNHCSASRFLVSDKLSKRRLAELAVQVELRPPLDGVTRELRRAAFHDRYLIGDHKVYGLGSSLNGVGKSMTTLIEMPDAAARTIRAEVENLWNEAEIVAQTLHDDSGGELQESSEVQETEAATGQSHQGIFQHDGCSIKHRSKQALQRCRNGQ